MPKISVPLQERSGNWSPNRIPVSKSIKQLKAPRRSKWKGRRRTKSKIRKTLSNHMKLDFFEPSPSMPTIAVSVGLPEMEGISKSPKSASEKNEKEPEQRDNISYRTRGRQRSAV